MTDFDYDLAADDALIAAVLPLLREHGPLTLDEIRERLASGDAADDLILPIDELPDHPMLVYLSDGRYAAFDELLGGRVLTHRLTEAEVASAVLPVDEIHPLLVFVTGDEDYDLVEIDREPDRLEDRGIADLAPFGNEALVFPRGAFAELSPGDLVSATVTETGLMIAPATAETDTVPELAAVLGESLASGDPAYLESSVFSAMFEVPTAFTVPSLPLSEQIETAGLEVSGGLVAPPGFDFAGYLARSAVDSYAEQVGVPVEAVPGVVLFASLVDAISDGDDSDLESRFAEGKSGLFAALADTDVAMTVVDELLEQAIDPASIERAALWMKDHGPRKVAAAAFWIAGKAAETAARVDDAARYFERSTDLDSEFDPALEDLARYLSDSGDAVRALSLLGRSIDGPDHPLYAVLETFQPIERPDLGRNDRCWCGSGRKYKACHLGKAEYTLEDRAPWLYFKACMQMTQVSWRDHRFALAEARSGYSDNDDDLFEALSDPLLDDVMLGEGGGLAEFAEARGHLLPDDERELLARWLPVERSVHEVEAVRVGEGLTLRDIRTGERRNLTAPEVGEDVPVGGLLCARVVPVADTWRILGAATPVTQEQSDAIVRLIGDSGQVDVYAGVVLVELLTDFSLSAQATDG
ncbi:SEC-C domain-containing protein [Rhodococcus artemisiae]|uniref:SEC-C domain-containing protein n=1 Tax=Rhodococcus artemisiae TaxID=714159 RepID=A0ABU7LFB7_9NOCA|nr:SEC-C domain-containing protein [Rhodococcus artemisiae]MEE2059607.1 SEC-C domain-containing protein [Rhodococcus artemisiae]